MGEDMTDVNNVDKAACVNSESQAHSTTMSSTMHKPDKATTERNTKILRELVKQPENKLCADCKRNGAHAAFPFCHCSRS